VNSSWATPAVWRCEDREYLLCATVDRPGKAKMHLVDPAEGKILWVVEGLHANFFTLSPSEDHVMVNVGSSIIRKNANGTAPKDDDDRAPFGLPGCYRIAPEGAKRVWSFPDREHYLMPVWFDTAARPRVLIRDGLVYYSSEGPDREQDRRLIVAKVETGEVLANISRENDFWFQLMEDRILHCVDWSHGSRARFALFSTDPDDFRKLSGPWRFEKPLTTAYTVNMEPPVIAGRIFLRTETGTVVCYDLAAR